MDWLRLKPELNIKRRVTVRVTRPVSSFGYVKRLFKFFHVTLTPKRYGHHYRNPLTIAAKWFKHHGKKLTTASVATIVGLAMLAMFTPLLSSASSHSVTWSTQGDFENNASTTSDLTTRSNLDATSTAGNAKLGPSETATTPTTMATNTGTQYATQLSNQRKLVRDSSGYWYSTYFDSSNKLYVCRSTNTTPTGWNTPVQLAGSGGLLDTNSGGYSSLAIDRTNSYLWVTWGKWTGVAGQQRCVVTVCTNLNGLSTVSNWKKADTTTQGVDEINPGYSGSATGVTVTPSSIALDSSGNKHLAFEAYIGSNGYWRICFTKYTSSWSSLIQLDAGTASTNYRFPSLVIDSSDNLHCCWLDNGLSPIGMVYKKAPASGSQTASSWTKRDGTSGQNIVLQATTYGMYMPSLGIDSDNRLWVTTMETTTENDIWYNYTTSATAWYNATGLELSTTNSLWWPTVGFSSGMGANDKVFIFYSDDTNKDIVYKSSSISGTPSFDSETILYNGSSGETYPNAELNPPSGNWPGIVWDHYTGSQYDVYHRAITAPTTIATNLGANSATAYVHQRKLVRDSAGYWYAVYHNSSNQVYVCKSTDTTPSGWDTPVQLAGSGGLLDTNNAICPSVTIDRTNSRLWVVWGKFTGTAGQQRCVVTVCTNLSGLSTASNWKKADVSTQGIDEINPGYTGATTTNIVYAGSIALDSSGNKHLSFCSYIGANNYWRTCFTKYTSSWSSLIQIDAGAGTTNYASPSLVIDSSDYLHCAWRDEALTPDGIVYKKALASGSQTASNWTKRSGSAGQDTIIQDNNNMSVVQLGVDSNDRLWAVTYENTDNDIWYAYTTNSTTWSSDAALSTTNNLVYSTVGFSSGLAANKVFIFYTDTNTNDIKYKSSSISGTPSFGSETVLYDGASGETYASPELNPPSGYYPGVIWTHYTGSQYDVYHQGFGYTSPGTIGDTDTGLRYNSGTGNTATWKAIRWNASIPSGTSIEVAVKSCGADWSGTYSAWQSLSDGDNLSDETPTPVNITSLTSATQCLEIKVRLNSSGNATPTLLDLKLDCNKPTWNHTTSAATLAPPSVHPVLGNAFVGGNDNYVRGMSTTDGTQAWTPVSTGGAIQSRSPVLNVSISGTPTYVIYSASSDGYLYAINASTGVALSSFGTNGMKQVTTSSLQGGIAAQKNLTISGQDETNTDDWVLFIGTYDNVNHASNKLYALDAVSGATLWTQNSINLDFISASPCVDSSINTVYFTSYDNSGAQSSLWAVNTADGTVRWSKALGNISSSPTKGGSNIYVATNAGYLYKYPSQTSEPSGAGPNGSTWRFDATAGGVIYGYPWYSSGGKIYFSTTTPQGRVYCVNDDGTANTSFGSPNGYVAVTSPSAPLVNSSIGTGKVYVGSSDGKIHELALSDGTESGYAYIGSVTVGSPTYDYVKGYLYVGATDGKIYSFNVASGL